MKKLKTNNIEREAVKELRTIEEVEVLLEEDAVVENLIEEGGYNKEVSFFCYSNIFFSYIVLF